MDFILNLAITSMQKVWLTFQHNWPFLVFSILLAAALKLFLDPKRVSAFLMRHQKAGVVGATAVAVTTPLCSCGTTAIVLGMIANMLPWAPIVAFMVASPLTSPEELVYSAGLFGWRFATAFFVASIFLGLAGGLVAGICESRGWLANQTRLSLKNNVESRSPVQPVRHSEPVASQPVYNPEPLRLTLQPAGVNCCTVQSPALLALDTVACGCDLPEKPALLQFDSLENYALPLRAASSGAAASNCACSETPANKSLDSNGCSCSGEDTEQSRPVTMKMFLAECFETGKRLVVLFLSFAFIGYFLNGLIPPAWVAAVFGSGNVYSIPLAATLGLPLYINTEASLPLVRAMLDSGMSQGAALAFLITGAGTSFGAVAGMLTIARWRVVALVVGTLWVGGMLFGAAYNFLF